MPETEFEWANMGVEDYVALLETDLTHEQRALTHDKLFQYHKTVVEWRVDQ